MAEVRQSEDEGMIFITPWRESLLALKSFSRKMYTISDKDGREQGAGSGETPISYFSITAIHSQLIWQTASPFTSAHFHPNTSPPSLPPIQRKFAFNVLARDKALSKFNLFMNNFPVFVNFLFILILAERF